MVYLDKDVIKRIKSKMGELIPDEAPWLIENKGIRFILCGSSARKLKRGHANLLGGRGDLSTETGSFRLFTRRKPISYLEQFFYAKYNSNLP